MRRGHYAASVTRLAMLKVRRPRHGVVPDGLKAQRLGRALGLVQVAGADLRLLSCPGLGLTRCLPVVALSLRIHLLSAISTREMTKIGIGWLIGSQDAIGTLKYLSVREDSYQSRRLISKNPLFRKDFVSFNQRGVNRLLKPLSDITTPALLGLHRHRVIAPVVHFVPPSRQHIG